MENMWNKTLLCENFNSEVVNHIKDVLGNVQMMDTRDKPWYGSSKANPRHDSQAFYIGNWEGDPVYVEARLMKDCGVIEAKIKAIKNRLEYCLSNELLHIFV
ncbi:hypothetical protein H5410_060833 [Solanum commersonii]|uniref:Uncharacterized protein n=1 Tax=Solanum commersonii TaxID=4109 RepID=A0A9J5W635_SOLCO|nr:hypothetical protein H5410_060833 [Solanum commersonii]